jgi:hypothetical protein
VYLEQQKEERAVPTGSNPDTAPLDLAGSDAHYPKIIAFWPGDFDPLGAIWTNGHARHVFAKSSGTGQLHGALALGTS